MRLSAWAHFYFTGGHQAAIWDLDCLKKKERAKNTNSSLLRTTAIHSFFLEEEPEEEDWTIDWSKAVPIYKAHADLGDRIAYYNLGLCLYNGKCALLPAVTESFFFFPSSFLYYNSFAGYGVDEDRERAAQFFMKAEEKKYLNGINSLGLCYYRGHGVAQDIEKAILLFKAAADRG